MLFLLQNRIDSEFAPMFFLSEINECATDPCHVNATCQNTDGSYDCSCNDGYTGNGTDCTGMFSCWVEREIIVESHVKCMRGERCERGVCCVHKTPFCS